jgi:glycosyltransferase involved in cell wall biosynthesis
MKSESMFVSTTGSVLGQSVSSDESSPCIIVFIAGEQSCVEAAVLSARGLYLGRRILFVCEPRHHAWLPRDFAENIFVVEQPFNPFGRTASGLLKDLQAGPIEACLLVVADLGFESFRFRVFALRLRSPRYVLLRTAGSRLPKPMGRIWFTLLAGATLLLRVILKLPGLDAFQKSLRAGFSLGLPKSIDRPILTLPKSMGAKILTLPKDISRAISFSMRVVRRRLLACSNAFGQRLLTFLARFLPPFDQPLAVGLAWLARIRLRFGSSRARAANEIVHVIPSIGMGGVQRQIVLLLKNRSPDYNHRVVVLRSQDRFFAPELSECGVGVYYLDSEEVRSALALSPGQQSKSDTHPLLKVVTLSLPFCCEIIKLSLFLRSFNPRPDLVHCWLLYANLAGSIAARLAKIPLVVTSVRNIQSEVNYNYYDPRWQRALERATAPLANAITANAPAVATDYKTFARARAEQVVTVPNGVDVEALHRLTAEERASKRQYLGLSPDNVVIGTVARLAKEKDFETFLRAVARACEKLSPLRSVIVGEGPLRAHLELFASSLDLTGVVQFLGERKDVGDLIQCYDAFLLTSVIEGMPNAVMESQLLGVPVIATRAGGSVDLIRDGETGLLAPIGDHQALASCIVRLFAEDGLWGRISLAAAKQIREGYTIEQLVVRTEAVYQALLIPTLNMSESHVRNSWYP